MKVLYASIFSFLILRKLLYNFHMPEKAALRALCERSSSKGFFRRALEEISWEY